MPVIFLHACCLLHCRQAAYLPPFPFLLYDLMDNMSSHMLTMGNSGSEKVLRQTFFLPGGTSRCLALCWCPSCCCAWDLGDACKRHPHWRPPLFMAAHACHRSGREKGAPRKEKTPATCQAIVFLLSALHSSSGGRDSLPALPNSIPQFLTPSHFPLHTTSLHSYRTRVRTSPPPSLPSPSLPSLQNTWPWQACGCPPCFCLPMPVPRTSCRDTLMRRSCRDLLPATILLEFGTGTACRQASLSPACLSH